MAKKKTEETPEAPKAPKGDPNIRLIRLKPYNKKAGNLLKRLMVRVAGWKRSRRFVNGTWYKVTAAEAKELGALRQIYLNPNSNLAFDVCTETEAVEMQEDEERVARGGPGTVEAAMDLTTKDLPQRSTK